MSKLLEGLNKQQQQAVKNIGGSLLILAGAGSGKTKVLTTRIANLVENGIKPYNIMAVTFTNKAAKEMQERLSAMISPEAVKKMWVGTFHSICGRILRYDIDKYTNKNGQKWDKNFVIYDETDSQTLLKNIIKKLDLDDKIYQPKLIKTVISNAKNKMQDAYTFQTFARDYRQQKYAAIYDEYEKTLAANNAIDFDDMLLMAVNLFTYNEEIRAKYFERFSHILVDEFQDTNIAQYNLIKNLYTNNLAESELKNRSLCVVGDVDQSIYSWRGADYRIILNFQTDFRNSELIKLEQNYRSVETILNAANSVIENNQQRISKNLYSTKGKGEKIHVYEANSESQEANYIAQTISDFPSTSSYNDTAVLYRTNAQSRAIEEAFIASSIPYKMVGGLKFYDRKEIKDIIAYLKLLYNRNDSQSLKRIINVPKRNIGETTMKKIDALALENNVSCYEIMQEIDSYSDFSANVQNRIKEFLKLLDKLQANMQIALDEFILYVIEQTGYLKELEEEDTEESKSRIENLQELINVAKEFESQEPDNIVGEFLSQVALVSDLDETQDTTNAVTMMTVHSAKGLEYPNIFIAGLEDGIFPHSRSINDNQQMEEERRLMYVAITRAQEKLVLTYAKRRMLWGDTKYFPPSRFMEEIPPQLLDREISQNTTSQRKTFSSAIEKIKSERTINSNSFGKNFIAPQYKSLSNKITTPQKKPNSAFVVKKNPQPQMSDDEKIKKLLENNPIKKRIEEEAKEAQKLKSNNFKPSAPKELKVGARVFHQKFGIGHIEQIVEENSAQTYVVDFGTQGKKSIDASFSNLKVF